MLSPCTYSAYTSAIHGHVGHLVPLLIIINILIVDSLLMLIKSSTWLRQHMGMPHCWLVLVYYIYIYFSRTRTRICTTICTYVRREHEVVVSCYWAATAQSNVRCSVYKNIVRDSRGPGGNFGNVRFRKNGWMDNPVQQLCRVVNESLSLAMPRAVRSPLRKRFQKIDP